MAERKIEMLLGGGSFFEGPRWRDGHWYVSDFFQHRVLKIAPDGLAETFLEVPHQPSGIGWLADGSMLVSSMKDHKVLRRRPSGRVTVHAEIGGYCGGWLNDMVVDGYGRAWCGNFGYDLLSGETAKTANLVRVDPDGGAVIAASGLNFPNGSVVTPDNRTLIVGETSGGKYTAFDIASDGSLMNRRVWALLPDVTPDGCSLDAEDCIWCADARGKRFVRVAEGGKIMEAIATPRQMSAIACMIGGADGRTLLLACSPPGFPPASTTGSCLMITRVDVPHAGYP
jgi:sugar lactone lactonase YvrE